jgi:hypothetical protein
VAKPINLLSSGYCNNSSSWQTSKSCAQELSHCLLQTEGLPLDGQAQERGKLDCPGICAALLDLVIANQLYNSLAASCLVGLSGPRRSNNALGPPCQMPDKAAGAPGQVRRCFAMQQEVAHEPTNLRTIEVAAQSNTLMALTRPASTCIIVGEASLEPITIACKMCLDPVLPRTAPPHARDAPNLPHLPVWAYVLSVHHTKRGATKPLNSL